MSALPASPSPRVLYSSNGAMTDLTARDNTSPQPASRLSEEDIDRFATLFMPATPPATPTGTAPQQAKPSISRPTHHRRLTQSSIDSEFGSFVSVPRSLDPLFHDTDHSLSDATSSLTSVSPSNAPRSASSRPVSLNNTSLDYFDRFTSVAKTAAERNRKDVLDELLEHQDDPLYFIDTLAPTPTLTQTSPLPSPSPTPIPKTKDEEIAEALASEMTRTKLIRMDSGGSIKVAPSPSRSRVPLSPCLSESATPPSISSPTGSSTYLPMPTSISLQTPPLTGPAHGTLSRISSSLSLLLPAGRPKSTVVVASSSAGPSSAPSTISRFASHSVSVPIKHGSPFASIPYTPPTGAPGFAGDRAWDRGFSETLQEEEKLGIVDPTGLGVPTEMQSGIRHAKGKGVKLVGRRDGTVGVLNEDIGDLIRPHLPALTKLPRHWTLLYSLDQHGISLNTLYSRCEPRIPSRADPNPPKGGLLAVQDARDVVFGAWLSEGVKLEKGYYGSGESFLWRYHPPQDGELQGTLDVYKWTGTNDYVALCETGFISLGGGDGHYGLYIDASLLDGSSASCPTFANPPLCSPQPHVSKETNGVARAKLDVSFECVGLEVWGVGS